MFDNYDDILTVEQLTEILFIGRNAAYRLLNSGEIKAFQIGNSRVWKIPRSSIEEYIVNCCSK
ncbi:helix-turn-helix domain-containing protein [Anaerosolibacter sp.]|uniref:helix-turn-helix domain-containing protein n=1 Tax=Anaerosolibacter sp. TaxID=1872527 RepID=UPI0039F0531D